MLVFFLDIGQIFSDMFLRWKNAGSHTKFQNKMNSMAMSHWDGHTTSQNLHEKSSHFNYQIVQII